MSSPKPQDDAALDALAAALAPRVARLLLDQAGDDSDLAELLGASGFELDTPQAVEAAPVVTKTKVARAARKGRAA